jgi:putative phosphonate metabolism protein
VARYAIYYAPPVNSRLWRFGTRWLGRDPATGERLERSGLEGFSSVYLDAVTATPRRYGLHATLKPPFALAAGKTPEMLHQALLRFAASRRPFALPPLKLTILRGFLALCLTQECPRLRQLAADCVGEMDEFRAPPSSSELARRQSSFLSLRQRELLARWGYPFVFEEFRFHLTLSGSLPEETLRVLQTALQPLWNPVGQQPLGIAELCLFVEPGPKAPFRLVHRYPFRGSF